MVGTISCMSECPAVLHSCGTWHSTRVPSTPARHNRRMPRGHSSFTTSLCTTSKMPHRVRFGTTMTCVTSCSCSLISLVARRVMRASPTTTTLLYLFTSFDEDPLLISSSVLVSSISVSATLFFLSSPSLISPFLHKYFPFSSLFLCSVLPSPTAGSFFLFMAHSSAASNGLLLSLISRV